MIITFASEDTCFSFDIAKDAMPNLKYSFLAHYGERGILEAIIEEVK